MNKAVSILFLVAVAICGCAKAASLGDALVTIYDGSAAAAEAVEEVNRAKREPEAIFEDFDDIEARTKHHHHHGHHGHHVHHNHHHHHHHHHGDNEEYYSKPVSCKKCGGGGGGGATFATSSAGAISSGDGGHGGHGGFGGSQSASQSAAYNFGPFSASFSASHSTGNGGKQKVVDETLGIEEGLDPSGSNAEIGQPAFDEIIVESTLTVRGKSGPRSGKSLPSNSRLASRFVTGPTPTNEEKVNGSTQVLSRRRRAPYARSAGQNFNDFRPVPFGFNFPGHSSSAAQASSNAFNSNTPFGKFGAAASQSSSQSQNYGPNGFEGSQGHSASQTYFLPNGGKIDVSFSNSYSVENGRPSFANSQAVTYTAPDGKVHTISG
ncbi:hypothetical protein RUM43_013995 [Polyplax serrata]|uniref:Uncharacterized protein n=1 Tax=Polyplax serrata TaxID=468196 RepID=A0AAN8P1L7_POLSC